MTPDPAPLYALADRVLARTHGDEAVEVYLAHGSTTSVRAYRGEVESFTSATSQGVGIRVVDDTRQGFAYAGSFDDDVVDGALEEARDNAGFAAPDGHIALPGPDDVTPAALDTWSSPLLDTPVETKTSTAIELERRVIDADPRITGVRAAGFSDSHGVSAVVTTTGIRSHTAATFCSVGISALAADDGDVTIGYAADGARRLDDLDTERVVVDAATRATRLLGARQPASVRLAIVLEPRLVASVLSIVGRMLTGEQVLKGRSPFGDRLGETIASPELTLVDDPSDERSLTASAIDGEGLASRGNSLIAGGVLERFLHNTYTGNRSGSGSTASAVRGYASTPGVGPRALAMAPGEGTLDALIGRVELGLLVQSMTGLHSGVNPVSGDFSVGAEGLMIRDGELAEPVREVTIASTLPRMLLDVVAVGGALEWLPGGSGAAALVIDGVSLSGS